MVAGMLATSKPWYHSTSHPFAPGDLAVPGVSVDRRASTPEPEDDDEHNAWTHTRVWVTQDLTEAAYFAAAASNWGPPGDPVVVVVEPADIPAPAPSGDLGFHTPSATVVSGVSGARLDAAVAAAAELEPNP
jgi:hypothetical protein